MQEINFTGAVISEPKTYGLGDDEFTQFYAASTRIRRKDEEKKTDYFSVKAYGKRSDFVKRFLHKSMKVYVKGELQAEVIERPTGKIDLILGVRASTIEFLGRREDIDNAIMCVSDEQDEYIDIAEDLVGW